MSFRLRRPRAPIPFALDSGAFMFYTKHGAARDAAGKLIMGKGATSRANHGYSSGPAFQRYFDAYCQFVRDFGHLFSFCASLDVIANPTRSLELYREMRRQGLKVLPVYHYGEDVSILKAYLQDAEYIGIGGLVKSDMEGKRRFLERTWAHLLRSDGSPVVRVHAFGLSSLEVVSRFPYASTDAVTPIHDGATGRVCIPSVIGSRFDYSRRTYVVVSDRSTDNRSHVGHLTGRTRETVDRYFAEDLAGLDLSSYFDRRVANLIFLQRAMQQFGRGCVFYLSGGMERGAPNTASVFSRLVGLGKPADGLGFLGTYSDIKEITFQLKVLSGFDLPAASVATAQEVFRRA